MNNEQADDNGKRQRRLPLAGVLTLGIVLTTGFAAMAQQSQCANAAMEKRLYGSLVQNGPSGSQQLSPARLNAYALCHIRIVCSSGLDRTEFEMYAIDTMASFGDAQAEREKAARWSRDGRKHQSAMDKVPPPRQIDAQCLGNAG